MALSPGTRLSRYEIRSKIGEGGMGEVYLAEDTRLRRPVALKILPPHLAADRDRLTRFEREAFAASALNHPNILTIFEFGTDNTTHFLASEFVAGETLRARLRRGALTVSETLENTLQIASALHAAHTAGIIHRDIKPENVMIREDGYIKVLDFGLAKLLEEPARAGESDEEAQTRMQRQTRAGMILGTVAYMSPEQARGKLVDARSDIFSLGVVLYEMLARRPPFTGETINHTIVAILEQEPPPVSAFVGACPFDVGRIINKALAKESSARYQSARELLVDLKEARQELEFQSRLERSSSPGRRDEGPTRIFTAAATAEEKQTTGSTERGSSIAVLPFANMSADEENEYFCDGLAEELLNALAKIDDLKVAARTSAFSFKGKNAEAREIGRILNVKTVLEGSVRKSGNRIRITVQLVNAADGFHLWSERYDREMQGIFELQDEITLAVIDALKVKLLGNERDAVLKRYTDNAKAYELFLKGRYHHFKYTAAGWKRAIEFFEMAIEIEPSYAPAYAAMTYSWGILWFFGLVPSEAAIAPMKEAAAKALQLDQGLAEAHLSSAMVTFFYDWDWRKAEEEFRCALDLNPSNAEALSFYSMFLALEDRFDEAIMQSKRSLAIDPLSPLINMNAGWTYFTGGMMDKARKQVGKMIEIESGFYGAYWLQGAIYLAEGSYDQAVDELRRAVSLGGHQTVLADLGSAYALAGRTAEAESVLNQLLETRQHEYVSAICIARVYCRLGETERTIEWLEKSFAERNGELLFFKGEIEGAARSDPLIDLNSDGRVTAIFQKMNLAKES